jgi:hypothetical protein
MDYPIKKIIKYPYLHSQTSAFLAHHAKDPSIYCTYFYALKVMIILNHLTTYIYYDET